MIPLNDRQTLAHHVRQAQAAGARLQVACTLAGIDSRTLQRWERLSGLTRGDGRPEAVRKTPSHALSAAERARILEVANESRFAKMPPARIVPKLADEGVYLASESTFSRVLRSAGQTRHRGLSKDPPAGPSPHDSRRHRPAPGVVLGYDVFTGRGHRALVLSLPDPRSLQPQDRGLYRTGHG